VAESVRGGGLAVADRDLGGRPETAWVVKRLAPVPTLAPVLAPPLLQFLPLLVL
jgi:hypothetical protein